MSYAEAAASSGPANIEKIPEPAKLERTSEPQGSVETLDAEEFEKQRHEAAREVERVAADAAKASKKQAKQIKKEFDEIEKNSAPYLSQMVGYVKEKYAALSSALSSRANADCASSAAAELQNPVVLSQLALIAGGATAGWYLYAERAHIRSENKYVLAIHAAIATGLVLGDVYVFQNLYPKYKKA
ncbi:hypothetical protein METBIDRAFT_37495 [Metschnikowia bicuspidata var. bicuspidata NRRL YB-4993]|uniref:Mitochondrial outer membrane protein OM14 C-terminal domain-containing protein n=1 Tax=Metschnikowia bicuspidata var. bicuspidata NRRL YB-4993 TaxID=869754 RepID=A0A1A0HJZ8_9ASCO|nr:hypothetical protein METBIDRAFT_37495 [Metschnikowia bicuspidata var. bicuspidata NRRL YB-4993]OBA24326.1 hypothetical protein METBIDRAFT_37495 [Metschnikowia bicuspidata var. bicuspidata NRRL YB-4993]